MLINAKKGTTEMLKVKTLSKKPTVARRFEEDCVIAYAKSKHLTNKIDAIMDIDSRDITNVDSLQLRSCIASMNRILEILDEIESEAM